MITDVVTLVTPTDPRMSGCYLAPPAGTSGGNPNITYLGPLLDDGTRELWYLKGLAGYPWDGMVITNTWIRQRLTENIWSDPSSGKLECISGLGVRRLPRYIITDLTGFCEFQWTMTRPETDYWIIPSGGQSATRNTDNGVRCTFRGPYPAPANGDLPAGLDWIEDYEWGGQLVNGVMIYSTLEQIHHRQGFGRYMWQSFASDGKGGYGTTPTASSMQNRIVVLPSSVVPVQKIW